MVSQDSAKLKTKTMTNNVAQVHADAANFAEGVSKDEALRQVLEQASGLIEGQRNWVCAAGCCFDLCCGVCAWAGRES